MSRLGRFGALAGVVVLCVSCTRLLGARGEADAGARNDELVAEQVQTPDAAAVVDAAVVKPASRAVLRLADAGKPDAAASDAGSSQVADAGARDAGPMDAGPLDPGHADAGKKPGPLPTPAKGALAVSPVNGRCPDAWVISESMCRRQCTTEADCPRGAKCAPKGGTRVCTSDH